MFGQPKKKTLNLVNAALAERAEAAKRTARAHQLLRRAADALAADGVGRRGAAKLLGVTFQRVQQITTDTTVRRAPHETSWQWHKRLRAASRSGALAATPAEQAAMKSRR